MDDPNSSTVINKETAKIVGFSLEAKFNDDKKEEAKVFVAGRQIDPEE
jgi:hypothetical protein